MTNTHIQLYFAYSDIACSDTIYIYDGPDMNAPLIGKWNNCSDPLLYLTPIDASIYNISGCLTVHFFSDGVANGTGWSANIDCHPMCQDIIANLNYALTSPSPDTNYIAICPGEEITFSATGSYPQNDYVYNQQDATSTFTWYFGDGTFESGQTVNHTYPTIGGFDVMLIMTDINGCESSNSIDTRVVIAGNPFNEIFIPDPMCVDDTMELSFSFSNGSASTIVGDPFTESIETTLGVTETLSLPDGDGECYETSVFFNCFAPGQTLHNAWDVVSVCADLEHTFLGDLEISLICPNGQAIILKEFPGGGGTSLGIPNPADDGVPGIGEWYCWAPSPTFGTMVEEALINDPLLTGSYAPFQSFAGLVGCPLNGEWTIQICDNWLLDDGTIFGWELTLNPYLTPNHWTYSVGLDQMGWTAGPYIVDDNESSIFISPEIAGSFDYVYTVVDHYGCSWDTSVTVTAWPSPSLDLGQDISICDQAGSVLLDAGNPGSNFLWQNGSASQTFNVTTTGLYSVTVSNAVLCSVHDDIFVNLGYVGTQTAFNNVNCYGSNSGNIDLTVTAGLPPFTFNWSNGAVSEDLSSLTDGIYAVTITDAALCSSQTSVTITEPAQLQINSQSTDIDCYQSNNGAINQIVSGGVPVYSFNWSNGSVSEDLSNLAPGIYSVTITDANACTLVNSYIIDQPTALQSNIVGVNNLCFGYQNGQANLTVTGGTPGYNFIWNNAQVGQSLNNLPDGIYSVTITDANNCTISSQIGITGVAEPISTVIAKTDLLCYGYKDGNIDVVVNGGTLPYNYLWNSGHTSTNLNALGAGNYVITVTDANDCKHIDAVTINQPDELMVGTPAQLHLCKGHSAIISAAATGGTAPYNYVWSNGSVASQINEILFQNTLYSVSVTDANNCPSNTSFSNVILYPDINLQVIASDVAVCPGDPVVINTSISGGTGGPYYIFMDGVLTNLPATIYPSEDHVYTISAKDNCPNVSYKDIDITLYDVPPVNFISDKYEGCVPVEVQFNEISNNSANSYVWTFGNGEILSHERNPLINFENDGIHDVSLTVTSEDGCSSTQVWEEMISAWPLPRAFFDADPSIASIMKPVIHFNNVPYGDYSFHWNFGDGTSSDERNPVHTYTSIGVYPVIQTVINEYGCEDIFIGSVKIKPEYTFYAPSAFTPSDDGINNIFNVFGVGIDSRHFEMRIYDRWGEVVFRTYQVDKGWDGRIKGKDFGPTAVYTWNVLYRDLDGNEHFESGPVTLIR